MSVKSLLTRGTAALAGGALVVNMSGCAVVDAYGHQAENRSDPCSGMQITPYSPLNHAMAREAAGLNARQFTTAFNPYVSTSYFGYGTNGVPNKAVYVIPTVNGINNIVTVTNPDSQAGKISGFFLAAALAGIGNGGVNAALRGIGFGTLGAEAGKQGYDRVMDNYDTAKINMCFGHVASGRFDYAVSPQTGKEGLRCKTRPEGGLGALESNRWKGHQGNRFVENCPPGVKGME